MKLGRLHIQGPSAWPDHLLNYELGSLIVGLVLEVRGWAIGFELQGWGGPNPWLAIYLGWWAFEAYLDVDGSWGDDG